MARTRAARLVLRPIGAQRGRAHAAGQLARLLLRCLPNRVRLPALSELSVTETLLSVERKCDAMKSLNSVTATVGSTAAGAFDSTTRTALAVETYDSKISAIPKPGLRFSFGKIECAIGNVIVDHARSCVRAENLERVKKSDRASNLRPGQPGSACDLVRCWAHDWTQHRRNPRLAGRHPRRHRPPGACGRSEMARQETLRDRLSHDRINPEQPGKAIMTYSFTRRAVLVGGASLSTAMLASPGSLSATGTHAATKIQRLVSSCGIVAWFVQDATAPSIAMEYAFGGGATQDPTDKPGVGYMVSDLLDEGSGDLDSRTFHERLDRRAIELCFGSTRDHLRGALRTLEGNRDEAFDLLRMALTTPRFDAADVERIRARMLANLRHESTDPSSVGNRKLFEVAFSDHPYARKARGTIESVPKIEVADLKAYVRRVMAKDTLKIAVVGNVDPEALRKLLDRTFGGLPAIAESMAVPDVVAATPPQRVFIPLDVPQTVVTFGGPGVRRSEPDFMAACVVNHILGGSGLTSRLFREVGEKRGRAYSVHERLVWMDHSAIFVGNSDTPADRADETVEQIEKQARRIAEEGPTQQEIDDAKSYLRGSEMLTLDIPSEACANAAAASA
ncbi:putative Zn-dependent peptidase [Bradyrhizobium sp. i1.7.7]